MTDKQDMISVTAEAENGAGELVIEMSQAALQALGPKPGEKLIWHVGEDGKIMVKKHEIPRLRNDDEEMDS
ncbi:hypothetical protein N619_13665 [Ectopseudomonas oleovorans]|jgi:hypothetical protein|nr:hypothetical protein N619_13665 [Pseudomonas oleovorans]